MTIFVLLFLVLAAEADKQPSDTGGTFRVQRRSYMSNLMSIPVSRPLMHKIATPGRRSKNVLFVNLLKARKVNNLSVRYLREKARKGYLREKARKGYLREKARKGYLREKAIKGYLREAEVSRARLFRKLNTLLERYFQNKEISANIKQALKRYHSAIKKK